MTCELHRETTPCGLTLIVAADTDPLDPRREYDHAGQLACWHQRYNLGDDHDWEDPEAFRTHLKSSAGAVVLPVYLFDHSSLAISTVPFHCPWDSGQIGWIWMSRKDALKEFGGGGKRLTAAIRAKAEDCLQAEVREYHQYLSGDVWEVRVEDSDGEIVEACCGYYGSDFAMEEGRNTLASLIPGPVKPTVVAGSTDAPAP